MPTYADFVRDTVDAIKALPEVHSPLVEALPLARKDGLWLEFGVYKCTSLSQIAAARGPNTRVFGFDSFQGLPENWILPKGCFACAVPEPPEGAKLVIGMFEDTLASFAFDEPVHLLHVDSDLYSSAKTVFRYVQPHLVPGSVVVFDELWDYEGFENHEMKALYETGLAFRLINKGPSSHNPRGDYNGRVSMQVL